MILVSFSLCLELLKLTHQTFLNLIPNRWKVVSAHLLFWHLYVQIILILNKLLRIIKSFVNLIVEQQMLFYKVLIYDETERLLYNRYDKAILHIHHIRTPYTLSQDLFHFPLYEAILFFFLLLSEIKIKSLRNIYILNCMFKNILK